jgi:hypothetical protein
MGVTILKTILAPAADHDLTDLATVRSLGPKAKSSIVCIDHGANSDGRKERCPKIIPSRLLQSI